MGRDRVSIRDDIYALVVSQAELSTSRWHGVEHWARVRRNGVALLAAGAPGDGEIVELFALLHDCKRESEGDDPEHGIRARGYALELRWNGTGLHSLSIDAFDELLYALAWHDSVRQTISPSAAVCWDADRLDLPRVWQITDPAYLSTIQAREWALSRLILGRNPLGP